MTSPNISHPYPPSYRSSPSPPDHSTDHLPSATQDRGEKQDRGRRWRSPQRLLLKKSNRPKSATDLDVDQTIPLTAVDKERPGSMAMAVTHVDRREDTEERRDENGLALPPGWSRADEEAEREFLRQGMFDWKALMGWRYWIRKEWWGWYIAAIILAVLVALMTIYHDQIVDWLTPMANWMKDLPAGWTIPIAILFVLSFPPLFGQEIVAVLVGVVWGLWIGFGIVAAGTFAGEFGNFYAFKYCLRSTAEKYEKKNLNYACMAHIVREGGFWIVFVSRLSAIPGHFTTAVFATCGTGIWVFSIATILTLPKQLVVVYLGVIFAEAGEGQTDSRSRIISAVVLVVGFLVTIYAAWYIYRQMHKARVVVWRQRRMAAKEAGKIGGYSADELDPEMGRPKTFPEQEMEEVRSPILNSDAQQRHRSYQTPYDITYQSRDNLSYYDVDGSGPRMAPPERDIGYASRMNGGYGMPNDSTETFPTARPSGLAATGLQREPTVASMYAAEQQGRPTRHDQNDYANFPVPSPVGVAK